MRVRLSNLRRRLCNELQRGLPLCERPFADIAARLSNDERTILGECRLLMKSGVLRRLGAVINYRAIGAAGTLASAHVEENDISRVAGAISSLKGVSHNYLRNHWYNLWFTLQCPSAGDLAAELSRLAKHTGARFMSLPVRRTFKLDARFDVEGRGTAAFGKTGTPPSTRRVRLTKRQRHILGGLRQGLRVEASPFEFLCGPRMPAKDVLAIIAELMDKGVITRIGGIVNHRLIGLTANAMLACKVSEARIIHAGNKLAQLEMVSHCYERRPRVGWPYNLYAMMHARSMAAIRRAVATFAKEESIEQYVLLPTLREFKKQPVSSYSL